MRLTAPGHRGAAPAPPDVHSNAGESLPHSTQPGEGTQNFRVVARDVADDDVGVAERRELGEPPDDLLDRARDEGRGRDSAIPGGQDFRLHLVGVGGRLADVDVAVERDGPGRPAVGLAALQIERGLVARLVERERG